MPLLNEIHLLDDYQTTNADVSKLLSSNDKVNDVLDFDSNIADLPAMAVINGKYIDKGFDHQAAATKALTEYKVYPYSVNRGFIDTSAGVAFLILYTDTKGPFIHYLQTQADEYKKEAYVPVDFHKSLILKRYMPYTLQK